MTEHPDEEPGDTATKVTLRALERRGLVNVFSRHFPHGWQATLTAAGRELLESGGRPTVAAGSDVLARLIADVTNGGGTVTITQDLPLYKNAYRAAVRSNSMPEGWMLWWEPKRPDSAIVTIDRIPSWVRGPSAAVPVRKTLSALHPAVAVLRERTYHLRFKAPVRQRALRIYQGVAEEAERRGWQVPVGPKEKLHLILHGHPFQLTIFQEGGDRADQATGDGARLRLVIPDGSVVGLRSVADGQNRPLESKLGALLYELELRAWGDLRADARRRRDEERRQRARAIARERAAIRYNEDRRRDLLEKQAEGWEKAARIRAYLDAVERLASSRPSDEAEEIAQWVSWGRRHLDSADPLNGPLKTPEDVAPSDKDLEPYLPRWQWPVR